ncbi:hypothetical protein [Cereibacter azotoformans]|uniref:Uncharacterized protein n=1 Tax=Cereibacter azotoformans TaxID=43057 RepID=A0A2T5JSG2_9RHOB|nr:hypothetical protein [Cereibacter azotoformans]MBO4168889.1 hypothetical protein [Cereibacter azotoformans]PTR11165.1 hypothetical protein C8J28_12826 [Cereibacter azotoformans]
MRLPNAPIIAATVTSAALPALPIWQARSFYAQILLIVSVALNAFGIDLFRTLGEIGWGSTPEEVIATGDRAVAAWQQIAPLVFGLWAWIERRAPNFRLVWWGARVRTSTAAAVIIALLFAGLVPATVPPDAPGAPIMMIRGLA